MVLPWFRSLARPALALAPASRRAVVLGAFQRASSALCTSPHDLDLVTVRRQSGGPTLIVAPSTLHLALALPRVDALVADADVPRLVNRHVRPLLRALTRLGKPAQFPGRDVVTLGGRPTAWVGFAHHAASGACLFEALIGIDEPVWPAAHLDGYPPRRSPPLGGKAPASLRDVVGERIDAARVADVVTASYEQAFGAGLVVTPIDLLTPCVDERPPWGAVVEEVIGFVGASLHHDGSPPAPRAEIGGDFLASSDLIESMSGELTLAAREVAAQGIEPERRIEGAFAAALEQHPTGVIEGVREGRSLVEAARDALLSLA